MKKLKNSNKILPPFSLDIWCQWPQEWFQTKPVPHVSMPHFKIAQTSQNIAINTPHLALCWKMDVWIGTTRSEGFTLTTLNANHPVSKPITLSAAANLNHFSPLFIDLLRSPTKPHSWCQGENQLSQKLSWQNKKQNSMVHHQGSLRLNLPDWWLHLRIGKIHCWNSPPWQWL